MRDMTLAYDDTAGFWAPRPPGLDAVIARLDQLSVRPEFAVQRETALARALKPYLAGGAGTVLAPLPQESDLAALLLYCDYYPEDGQLTLIEQLRDVITEHIGHDERVWLDPLKHSYLDLLEVTADPRSGVPLSLRSIGDGTTCTLPGGDFVKQVAMGHVLLTRVVRAPEASNLGKAVWAGPAIVLTSADAQRMLATAADWRRDMEMASGSFTLGEWQEFTKRFGHMVLWAFAQLRMDALAEAVRHIEYRTADGQPYLYAVALYDHHEYRFLAEGLSQMAELTAEDTVDTRSVPTKPARRWREYRTAEGARETVARLTLTSAQLLAECDSPERLDAIKHRLAGAFGFSLHFRGETVTPPPRPVSLEQLASAHPLTLVATPEEDEALLRPFLDKAYLEWSDQGHLSLGGQTPRHAAAVPSGRHTVADLIDDMERHDVGLERLGRRVYDYNVLRAHVGLEEKIA